MPMFIRQPYTHNHPPPQKKVENENESNESKRYCRDHFYVVTTSDALYGIEKYRGENTYAVFYNLLNLSFSSAHIRDALILNVYTCNGTLAFVC